MKKKIIVGSRRSRLAVIQTELAIQGIREAYPEMEVEIKLIETTGDRRQDIALDKIGGKGLFIKELDRALLDGEIDLAVHSLKDLPMEMVEGVEIAAFSVREDARDALVLPKGREEWDGRGVMGCSSLRRKLQAEKLFPEADFQRIRGNVLTRLAKLDRGDYDGLILAAAGLKRLGLAKRIYRYFEPEEMLPSAGQGILAVTGRSGEDFSYLRSCRSEEAAIAAAAERAFVRRLDGGCSSPVAAYGRIQSGCVVLEGLYYNEENGSYRIGRKEGPVEEAEALGISLAEEMKQSAKAAQRGSEE